MSSSQPGTVELQSSSQPGGVGGQGGGGGHGAGHGPAAAPPRAVRRRCPAALLRPRRPRQRSLPRRQARPLRPAPCAAYESCHLNYSSIVRLVWAGCLPHPASWRPDARDPSDDNPTNPKLCGIRTLLLSLIVDYAHACTSYPIVAASRRQDLSRSHVAPDLSNLPSGVRQGMQTD